MYLGREIIYISSALTGFFNKDHGLLSLIGFSSRLNVSRIYLTSLSKNIYILPYCFYYIAIVTYRYILLIVHQCFLMILCKSIVRKATLQTTNKFLHHWISWIHVVNTSAILSSFFFALLKHIFRGAVFNFLKISDNQSLGLVCIIKEK